MKKVEVEVEIVGECDRGVSKPLRVQGCDVAT